MKNFIKIIPVIAIVIAIHPNGGAHAAEGLMPIKARIIRCVTHEERWQMCQQENLCCNLLDASMAEKKDNQQKDGFDVSDNGNIHTQTIENNGSVSVAIE